MPNQVEPIKKYRMSLLIISVFGIILLSLTQYYHTLDNWFTGTDTLTLIQSSIIQNPDDFLRLFTERMGAGSGFPEQFSFYRPLSSLTYSLDYAIWGLNPFGYHLSDLVFHTLVCLMVLFVAIEITKGNFEIAIISSVIFILHPLHLEVVSDPEVRHDVLSAVFYLSSLWWFARWYSVGRKKKTGFVVSLLCFVFALGSKETSAFFPCVIWSYVFIISERASFRRAIKMAIPYMVVLGVFFSWRALILHGLGGYQSQWWRLVILGREPWFVGPMIKKLIMTLWYPTYFIQDIGGAVILIPGAVFLVSIFLLLNDKDRVSKRLMMLQATLLIVPIAIMWIILFGFNDSYPVYEGSDYHSLENTTAVKNDGNESGYMKTLLPQSRLGMIRTLLLLSLIVFYLELILGSIRLFYDRIQNRMIGLQILAGAWMVAATGIHIIGSHFWHPYYGYHVMIPFSILGTTVIHSRVRKPHRVNRIRVIPLTGNARGIASLTLLIVTLFLIFGPAVYSSPVLRTYSGWNQNGELAHKILNSLILHSKTIDDERTLIIRDFPCSVIPKEKWHSLTSERYCLASYSVESWFRLHHPEFRSRISIENYDQLASMPDSFDIVLHEASSESLVIKLLPSNYIDSHRLFGDGT